MSGRKSKADIIDERKSNLPLPAGPPTASDWNSADERNVNVTRGSKEGADATRNAGSASSTGLRGGPATEGSGVREERGADLSGVGREGKEHLSELPNDALRR